MRTAHRTVCLTARLAALAVSLVAGTDTARAEMLGKGWDYLTRQRWLQAAERIANEQITYEVCGWGTIDLRIPFLTAAESDGAKFRQLEELAGRYDESVRERRRLEAVLASHKGNEAYKRYGGIHPTEGCESTLKERIEGARESWK